MEKILFITATRLGDAVLSTGLLNYLYQTYPKAKVTVACGPVPQSIFEGFPNVEQIIPLKKQKHCGHWRSLWGQCIGTKWDMIIDLRNSFVSRLLLAKKKYMYSDHVEYRNEEEAAALKEKFPGVDYLDVRHKVEQAAAVMKLEDVPAPKLYFTESQEKMALEYVADKEAVLAVGPTANWIGKTWPAERFIELIHAVTAPKGILPNAKVAIFAAPGEEEQAYPVLEALPKDKSIDLIAKTTPGEAAAILSRCSLYIGNDSGLMHCAAAAEIPTFGLFGPSWPHLYRPWGSHAEYVSAPEDFAVLTDFDGYDPATLDHTLMGTLKVEDALHHLEEFWANNKKEAA